MTPPPFGSTARNVDDDDAWQVDAIAEAVAEYAAEVAAGEVRLRDAEEVMREQLGKLLARLSATANQAECNTSDSEA